MTESIELQTIVPLTYAGLRLDQALSQLFPEYSRTKIQAWIKAGDVHVNNKMMRIKDKLEGGETVTISTIVEQQIDWSGQALPLDVVFADEDMIVINKPAGIVVHPGAGHHDKTLVNALVHHYPELQSLPRAGIVHRLDKDTTGLMVVARRLTAHTSLVKQLQTHQVQREYQAIVVGVMTAGGTINAPIGRHRLSRTKMAVVTPGKKAITHYRVIKRFKAHTHIRVNLETGRTHQIRVHMAYQGYPLVGDPVYGRPSQRPGGLSDQCVQQLRDFKRQALHAGRLALEHPSTGLPCAFEVALPADMQALLTTLAEEG